MHCAHPRFLPHLAAGCAAVLLVACGGGSDTPDSGETIGRNNVTDPSGQVLDAGCGVQDLQAQMLAEVNRVRAQGQQCGASWQPPVPALSWNAALGDTSMAHCTNLMRPDYRAFGGACVKNNDTAYKWHWTQVFGQ